jgi:hypothetical protein
MSKDNLPLRSFPMLPYVEPFTPSAFFVIKIQEFKIFLCFVDRASRNNCVKKNQLDAQLILSIFRQPVHVSGVSRLIIRRYNCMYATIGIYYSF